MPVRHARLRWAAAATAAVLVSAALSVLHPGGADAATGGPPFTDCPAIGQSPSCQVLLVIRPDQTIGVIGDPSVGPFDGSEDSLIGVRNNSGKPVTAITVTSIAGPISGFDGDGLCQAPGAPSGCPFGPTGYEGPGTSFATDPQAPNALEVDFAGGLADGASSYFSVEEAVTQATLVARQGHIAADSDGDGLPDAWESAQGRDLGGGLFDPTLHDQGATPDHKDVFVDIIAEKGAMLPDKAITLATAAYANAPGIDNPDGKPGIRLHILKDPTVLTTVQSDGMQVKDAQGGVAVDFPKLDDIARGNLEYHAYHFMASVLWDKAVTWSGLGLMPGQLIIYNNCGPRTQAAFLGLGSKTRVTCGAQTQSDFGRSDSDLASVFIHELGHNLGLDHGGSRDLAFADHHDMYKPNYPSVMNYNFDHGTGVPGAGITYSQWGASDVNVLDERSLVESDGVKSTNPANPLPAKFRTNWYCADGTKHEVAVNKPADWNCNGHIDAGRIAANIDWPAKEKDTSVKEKTLLSPSNDWVSLVYGVGNIGVATDGLGGTPIAASSLPDEPSTALRDELAAQLAAIPARPSPVIVSSTSSAVTVQVPSVTSATAGTLSWAPVLADGSTGTQQAATTVPAGKSSTLRFTVPRTALAGAVGIAVFLDNADWLVTGAARL